VIRRLVIVFVTVRAHAWNPADEGLQLANRKEILARCH
jgi:hypothetical protein